MSHDAREKAAALVAMCRCGGLVLASVIREATVADIGRDLVWAVTRGYRVRVVTVQKARKMDWCTCGESQGSKGGES